ncbi:helix-turn-helix transcriptional regulator [Microbacterium sp. QXD-8]|uniref:Helix-turn-helix transcriptional regulator n=1 Tax=Microbacterium psychrotolerans TaxID=3068321 RepID=A0ABU0YYA9_9MICO|nr:helix-turn-helix transcriptional regulator [Microbacterium sp. QXD-8]MDQ7877318.1 helix-turn-helix transcriptional regulator [Microbacterium sp. QXD-8]
MQDAFTEETPRIVLIRENLDKLRRANGIPSEAKLADILGVSRATLWRISNDKVSPSAEFIARALTTFPHIEFKVLFRVEQPKNQAVAV